MLSACNEPFLPTVVNTRIEREIAAQGIIPSAGVAKLADAQDLKSWDPKGSCGFDSHLRHQNINDLAIVASGGGAGWVSGNRSGNLF